VDAYCERAIALVGSPAEITASRDGWVIPQTTAAAPGLVCTDTLETIGTLAETLSATPGVSSVRASLAVSTVWATLDPDRIRAADAAALATGLWTIEGGDPAWKRDVPVWGAKRGDHALSTAIKREFDPANVLNRNRLFI
jgi:hypothetical protein